MIGSNVPGCSYAETKMRAFMTVRAIACIALAYACGVTPSSAQAVDYKGKQVTIVIGYGVGGTYSQYAQLFSHHLGKFLLGNPSVIVQSMPGAGGVRMLNEAAVRMRGDGTTIFVPPDTMVITQLLETSGIFYDARKFHYIGTADQQNNFWVIRRPAGTTIADMKTR